MSNEQWDQLQEHFDRLVDLEAGAREAALEELRTRDPEFAERLDRLLRSADADGELVDEAVAAAARGLVESEAEDPNVGRRVGPYRLTRELGRGGMGAVYLAERADGAFEQQIAIKLVPAGARNRRIVERFEGERQILAQLEHPYIARLLDGGTAADGLPYFVMEHVAGRPIDAFCDERQLTTTERLTLFRDVCAAVESAHRRLVVHRDLKPSNILVTDDGVPKLLDFGIAKILEPDTTPGEAFTAAGERVMTPEYASPEQVRSEPVSTATDVYALGLLLYEVLTGHRAHRLSSHRPDEVERVVCRDTPERPSTVVTDDPETNVEEASSRSAEEVSRARGTVPLRLRRRLTGDLDNIVMMALRKEPERRYGSVAELSEDVRRHLEGLPVAAHADSWLYRSRKFARRHAFSLVAALLVALSLVGGLVATTVQARRAELEARRAEETSEFLVELLESSDPDRAPRPDLTVREVLDRASGRIENELAEQPRLQATMQTVIGRLFLQLGLFGEAERQLQQSLLRREALLGAEHPQVSETRQFFSTVLLGQGRLEEAESEARRSLALRERDPGPASAEVARSLSALGVVLQRKGDFDEARAVYQRAMSIQSDLHGSDHVSVARIATALAYSELEAGRLAETEQLLRRALAVWRRQGAGESLDLAATLDALSGPLMLQDSLDEAEEVLRESLEIRRSLLADTHPLIVESLSHVGILKRRQRDMAGAESAYREALDLAVRAYGPEHSEVATIYNNLGVLMHVQDRFEEAAVNYRRSLEIRREALGPEHPLIGTTLSFLAFALHRAGDETAEPLYREALEQLRESRGGEHPDFANVLNDLGRILVERGRYAEAEPLLQDAARIRSSVFGDENRRTINARVNLGACLVGLGELSEGAEILRSARSQLAERYGEEGLQVVEADLFLALLQARETGRSAARAEIDRARRRILSEKGDDHWLLRLADSLEARI